MTEPEARRFLADSLRSVASHLDAMPDPSSPPLCLAIPGDFRLEALSQGRGCRVSVAVGSGSATVSIAVNDPEPEPRAAVDGQGDRTA